MAYTAGNLHPQGGSSVGNTLYQYDLPTDTLATMMAVGYFNNTDDNLNLAAGDMVFLNASDGTSLAQVASVSSGAVTLKVISNNQSILDGGLNSSITIPIGLADVFTFTPTSITLKLLMDSLPEKGQKITLINQGITSSVTLAISVASGAKIFSSDDLTSTITVKGGGAVTLLALTTSVLMQLSEASAVAPSTSPDVTYS